MDYVASALASDATIEVVNKAQTVSVKDSEWVQKVAEPAQHLALDTMAELAHGWGRALAVAYGVFWFFSLGWFGSLLGFGGGNGDGMTNS